MPHSFILVVPTLNAGNSWSEWIFAVQDQSATPNQVLVLDSESGDLTVEKSLEAKFNLISVPRKRFNHGGTRQLAVDLVQSGVEILVFMTQDAVLTNSDSLKNLLAAFNDKNVGAAYGRQLPFENALPLAKHARLFNYQTSSSTTGLADRSELGIKTCFLSNSFAAYRLADLHEVGGFPSNVILGEDTSVAARLLLAGKSIRYQADACVYHSHDYTPIEEFQRYFDIGVFHAREHWLLNAFGGPNGEGLRFVKSELKFLLRRAPWLIPSALVRTGLKLAGYRLGRSESHLPQKLKKHLSMFKTYWD